MSMPIYHSYIQPVNPVKSDGTSADSTLLCSTAATCHCSAKTQISQASTVPKLRNQGRPISATIVYCVAGGFLILMVTFDREGGAGTGEGVRDRLGPCGAGSGVKDFGNAADFDATARERLDEGTASGSGLLFLLCAGIMSLSFSLVVESNELRLGLGGKIFGYLLGCLQTNFTMQRSLSNWCGIAASAETARGSAEISDFTFLLGGVGESKSEPSLLDRDLLAVLAVVNEASPSTDSDLDNVSLTLSPSLSLTFFSASFLSRWEGMSSVLVVVCSGRVVSVRMAALLRDCISLCGAWVESIDGRVIIFVPAPVVLRMIDLRFCGRGNDGLAGGPTADDASELAPLLAVDGSNGSNDGFGAVHDVS